MNFRVFFLRDSGDGDNRQLAAKLDLFHVVGGMLSRICNSHRDLQTVSAGQRTRRQDWAGLRFRQGCEVQLDLRR
jgi:hypothetical protein